MDVEMSVTPNFDDYYFANPLKKAVENGEVKESDVDVKVERVIAVMDALHMLGDARATASRDVTPPSTMPRRHWRSPANPSCC